MKTKNGIANKISSKIPKQFDRSATPKSGLRSRYAPELNRTELGRKIGISRPHMSRILSGKIKPTVETLIKLRNALGMKSIDDVHEYLGRVRADAARKSSRQRAKITKKL